MRRGVPWSDAGNVCCPSPDPAEACSLVLLSASGCSSKAALPVMAFVRPPLAPCSPVDPLPGVPEPPLWATAMHKAVLPLKTAASPLQGINTSMYTCQMLRLTIAYACPPNEFLKLGGIKEAVTSTHYLRHTATPMPPPSMVGTCVISLRKHAEALADFRCAAGLTLHHESSF